VKGGTVRTGLAVLAVAGALATVGLFPTHPTPARPRQLLETPVETPPPVISTEGSSLLFGDEFDGPVLDAGRWQTCSWWAETTCSIETNHELELYTPENVSVADGVLTLQARPETRTGWNDRGYDYTSGMISTGGRSGGTAPGFTFTYGYMEARVRVPSGRGLWPAFWTLPADYSWPPEIDVMEMVGDEPGVTHMQYHYLDDAGVHQGPGSSWSGPDFSAGWHTFGVDWEAGALGWYVDGVERWRLTGAVSDQPSYLVLDLAIGGDRPGPPDGSTSFPADFLVDYVRVWDHVQTSRSGG
jgi:beta-glucanase (GH16 family)